MNTEKKLNDKQEMFVNEYLKCFNATRAAKNAGYSEKTAGSQGHDLLKVPEVASRVRERLQEAAMSANEVLFHLAQIARGDIDDLLDNHGNLDLTKARQLGKTNLIRKVKSRSITSENSDIFEAETEGYDRMRALELIGKHLAMFTDNIKVSMTYEDSVIADIKAHYADPSNPAVAYASYSGILADIFHGDRELTDSLFQRAGVALPATIDSADIER